MTPETEPAATRWPSLTARLVDSIELHLAQAEAASDDSKPGSFGNGAASDAALHKAITRLKQLQLLDYYCTRTGQ